MAVIDGNDIRRAAHMANRSAANVLDERDLTGVPNRRVETHPSVVRQAIAAKNRNTDMPGCAGNDGADDPYQGTTGDRADCADRQRCHDQWPQEVLVWLCSNHRRPIPGRDRLPNVTAFCCETRAEASGSAAAASSWAARCSVTSAGARRAEETLTR